MSSKKEGKYKSGVRGQEEKTYRKLPGGRELPRGLRRGKELSVGKM